MTRPPEDDLPPELLAAYADGELPPALEARVARWLAAHPEALRTADDQAGLSPANEFLMDELAVPMPTPREWAACQAGIREELAKPRRDWNFRPFLAGFTVAAGLLLVMWAGTSDRDFQPLAVILSADAEDGEMLVLAGRDDIEILSMPEAAAPLLLVGQLPWNEDLVLARAHELEYIGVGSDADGRFPDVPRDPTSDEAPLLWTPPAP